VEKLVELLSPEQLEIQDNEGFTALSRAVKLQNNIGMVDCMLRKNINLLNIQDGFGCIPLVTALEAGNLKVARHLYSHVYLPHQTFRDIDASNALYHFIRLNNFGKDTIYNYFIFFNLNIE
jgi:ankyrin repeat protein